MTDDIKLIHLWGQQVLGNGTRRAQAALDIFGGVTALFEASEIALRTAGIFSPAEVKTILMHNLTKPRAILQTATDMSIRVMTLADADYPELLKAIYSPPLCLFAVGDPAHLSHPLPIAMVGTRDPNPYGIEAAKLCAGGLAAAGALIVSGLAMGIDATCHNAALKAGAPTVAVLGCGIDIDYPRQNREIRQQMEAHGCIVSEYAPGEPPLPGRFPVRNRIISGLARGCVVVQGKAGSGSLITAGLALTQNRDVFALCGPVNDPLMAGCHELVRQGAKPVFGILDVLREYPAYSDTLKVPDMGGEAPKPAAPAKQPLPDYLTETQVDIVKLLRQSPQSVEAMAQFTGIAAGRLLALLTELEIYGLVEPRPGRTYRAV